MQGTEQPGSIVGLATTGILATAVSAVCAVWASVWFSGQWPGVSQWIAVAVLLALTATLAWRPERQSNRVVWDATAPLLLATALVAGFVAPVVIVVYVLADFLVSSRRQDWRLASLNTGIIAVRYVLLAVVIQMIPTPGGLSTLALPLLAGLAVTFLTGVLNHGLVMAAVRRIYGQWPALAGAWKEHVWEVGGSAIALVGIWLLPTSTWVALPLSTAVWIEGRHLLARYREHTAALGIEAQARIVSAEMHGPNPGHTERVVASIRRMAGSGIDSQKLEIAAWYHSVRFAGSPRRCNGLIIEPDLRRMVATLPGQTWASSRPLIEGEGFVDTTSPREEQILAAACAWDSRHLPASPVHDSSDIEQIFGVSRDISSRIAVDQI